MVVRNPELLLEDVIVCVDEDTGRTDIDTVAGRYGHQRTERRRDEHVGTTRYGHIERSDEHRYSPHAQVQQVKGH